jgi:hypothetical protein
MEADAIEGADSECRSESEGEGERPGEPKLRPNAADDEASCGSAGVNTK